MNQEVKFFTCNIVDETWSTILRTHRCSCPVCKGATIIAEKPNKGFQLVMACKHYIGASASMPPHVVVCFMMEQPQPTKKPFWTKA
jgi:hypothetical protein